MKIRNQNWLEVDNYIAITLLEPFWSAWQKYNWQQGVEGFGVSKEAIDYAIANKKHLRVHVDKYGTYDITPGKLELEAISERMFIPRDHKPIIVLPRYAFERVVTFNKEEYDKKEHDRSVKNAEQIRFI